MQKLWDLHFFKALGIYAIFIKKKKRSSFPKHKVIVRPARYSLAMRTFCQQSDGVVGTVHLGCVTVQEEVYALC